MVKVYSITTCPWCEKVKKYLKSKNVEFEEHNIELSEEDREECYKISGRPGGMLQDFRRSDRARYHRGRER